MIVLLVFILQENMSLQNLKKERCQSTLFPVANGFQVSFIHGSSASIKHNTLVNTKEGEDRKQSNTSNKKICAACTREKSLAKFNNIQKQNSLIPHIVSDKSDDDVPTGFVKQISKGLSFAEDVIEERSPYTVPYVQSKLEYVFREKSVLGHKQKLSYGHHKKGHARPHMPCHLTPINIKTLNEVGDKTIKRSTSSDSFLLGVSDSFDNLRLNLPKENISSLTVHKQIPEIKSKKKASHTWDEHVLALLSGSTADVILNNFTPNSQQDHLRKFLDSHSVKLKNNINTKDNSDKVIEHNDENNNSLRQKDTETKINDAVEVYFEDTSSSHDKVHHQKVLQDSFPCSPSLWSRENKNSTKSKHKRLRKGMQKWTEYPKAIQVKSLFISLSCFVSF